ncbi:odorant receptor 13a-like [Vespula squamosa]|uniref:Odorant receptor 13a-like n=1 Tax=Vespula squamosa TaxID=30214 RepID=A0ABD2C2A7_VESSQ
MTWNSKNYSSPHRLIRLADIFEHCFNVVIGQQLLGTTTQLCISSYEILSIHICRSNGTRFISNK